MTLILADYMEVIKFFFVILSRHVRCAHNFYLLYTLKKEKKRQIEWVLPLYPLVGLRYLFICL